MHVRVLVSAILLWLFASSVQAAEITPAGINDSQWGNSANDEALLIKAQILDWHLIRRHLCSSLFERSQRIGHPRRAQHQHLCHNASHDEAQGGDFDRQLIKPSEVIRHGR
jgi:hypothetical protein